MSLEMPPAPLPGSETTAPRKTNWVLIVGILAALLILCTLIVCVGVPMVTERYGGSAMSGLLSTMCQMYYPDLETDTCKAWGDDVWNNHLEEYQECNDRAKDGAGGTDPDALFVCLDEKGIGPKS